MFWMFIVYAVDTHVPLLDYPYLYESRAACEMDSKAVTENGKSYAVCYPVGEREGK